MAIISFEYLKKAIEYSRINGFDLTERDPWVRIDNCFLLRKHILLDKKLSRNDKIEMGRIVSIYGSTAQQDCDLFVSGYSYR